MTADARTLSIYESRVSDYARIVGSAPPPGLGEFMAHLKPGARVLDLGCGPGDCAAALQSAGYLVDPVDASPAMVAHAQETYGLNARLGHFDDIKDHDIYDGIWANFSLLHAPKRDFPSHLAALHAALHPGGIFHIGMKLGDGEARDGIGRFYAYYREDELTKQLEDAGFTPLENEFGAGTGLDGTRAPWIVVRSYA